MARVIYNRLAAGMPMQIDATIQFALGKQPLGSILLLLLMGPSGGGLLQWPVPAVVDQIRVGEGQLTITTQ